MIRRRIIAKLDRAHDACVESWRAMVVLLSAGTFVFFALVIFFGETVTGAIALTKVLVAAELVAVGVVLVLNLKYRRSINQWLDAADAIEAKIIQDDTFSAWDDFIADPAGDRIVEKIRLHCLTLPKEFPPATPDAYCNTQGIEILEAYVRGLRAGLVTRALAACFGFRRARPAKALSVMDDARSDVGTLSNMPDPMADPVPAVPTNGAMPIAPLPDNPVPMPAKKATDRKTTTTKAATKKTSTKTASSKKASTTKSVPPGRRVA